MDEKKEQFLSRFSTETKRKKTLIQRSGFIYRTTVLHTTASLFYNFVVLVESIKMKRPHQDGKITAVPKCNQVLGPQNDSLFMDDGCPPQSALVALFTASRSLAQLRYAVPLGGRRRSSNICRSVLKAVDSIKIDGRSSSLPQISVGVDKGRKKNDRVECASACGASARSRDGGGQRMDA